MNILDHAGWDPKLTPIQTHKIVESFKLIFGKLSLFGEATSSALIAEIQKLLTPEAAADLAALIGDSTSSIQTYINHNGEEPLIVGGVGASMIGQAHISVIDANRMAVSLSTSLGDAFGSGVVLSRTGVILNNGMAEFSTNPESANFFDPNKRPLTYMSPMIVMHDSEVVMSLGATGGSAIITSLVQALANAMKFRMSIPDAISEPRVHHQLDPNMVLVEPEIDLLMVKYLHKLGHEVSSEWSHTISTFPHLGYVTIAKHDDDEVLVATDPRTEITSSAIIR
jgi:gamma-glutamyltranspeptidase